MVTAPAMGPLACAGGAFAWMLGVPRTLSSGTGAAPPNSNASAMVETPSSETGGRASFEYVARAPSLASISATSL